MAPIHDFGARPARSGIGVAEEALSDSKKATAHSPREKISSRPWRAAANCALADFADMKAKIIITPKKAVVDPQGKTVQGALEHMGYKGVGAVHVGKYLEIELNGTDKESARRQIDEACHKILSNPVIEDYKFEIE
jgi:phosphoribosylformylglycinamidine synthase